MSSRFCCGHEAPPEMGGDEAERTVCAACAAWAERSDASGAILIREDRALEAEHRRLDAIGAEAKGRILSLLAGDLGQEIRNRAESAGEKAQADFAKALGIVRTASPSAFAFLRDPDGQGYARLALDQLGAADVRYCLRAALRGDLWP